MEIAERKVVHIHYTLKNDAGELLDKSPADEPLGYLHGAGNIIPGLEAALSGMKAGEEVQVEVPPEAGYGQRDEGLVQDVPRGAFEGIDEIEPGMQFQAESEQGARIITVTGVDNDVITVDGNHPLAGETLHFDVEVMEVREATAKEIEDGRPEQPASC